jgi:hypothetical protein
MIEKLPQSLRERIVVLTKEVIAINKCSMGDDLTFNRLSGAIYHELLNEVNQGLAEDDAVNLAVHITSGDHLLKLLSSYDTFVLKRKQQANRQVYGIVNNMISEDMPTRDKVFAETLAMLERFPLVRSITGIRKLVQARIENGHADVDEDTYMYLS